MERPTQVRFWPRVPANLLLHPGRSNAAESQSAPRSATNVANVPALMATRNPAISSWYGKYSIIYRVLYIPGDAGFLNHQQYPNQTVFSLKSQGPLRVFFWNKLPRLQHQCFCTRRFKKPEPEQCCVVVVLVLVVVVFGVGAWCWCCWCWCWCWCWWCCCCCWWCCCCCCGCCCCCCYWCCFDFCSCACCCCCCCSCCCGGSWLMIAWEGLKFNWNSPKLSIQYSYGSLNMFVYTGTHVQKWYMVCYRAGDMQIHLCNAIGHRVCMCIIMYYHVLYAITTLSSPLAPSAPKERNINVPNFLHSYRSKNHPKDMVHPR